MNEYIQNIIFILDEALENEEFEDFVDDDIF